MDKFYEVTWNDDDDECAQETVLGRFPTWEEADALAKKLGGGQVSVRTMPEEITEPGPSAKWSIYRSDISGDSVNQVMPVGEEKFRHDDKTSIWSGLSWSGEIYAATKEEAIQKFCDYFGLVWDGRRKGMDGWMGSMTVTTTPFLSKITMGGGEAKVGSWVVSDYSEPEEKEGGG